MQCYYIYTTSSMNFDCSFKWQAERTRDYREDMVDCFDEDYVFEQLIGLRDHDFWFMDFIDPSTPTVRIIFVYFW